MDLHGAENETRTRDPNLGKVVLYQLSYFRIGNNVVDYKVSVPFCQYFFEKNMKIFTRNFSLQKSGSYVYTRLSENSKHHLADIFCVIAGTFHVNQNFKENQTGIRMT